MVDTFVMSSRQAAELDHAFERNGWTPAEIKQLSSGRLLADIRKVLLGQAVIDITEHLIDLDADPFVPDGWSVPETGHRKGGMFNWNASKIGLYLSKNQGPDTYADHNEICKELKRKKFCNANLLDYLLAHRHLIPETWKGRAIFFWGTIYQNSEGKLCARYLFWEKDDWSWSYGAPGFKWYGCDPAAVHVD